MALKFQFHPRWTEVLGHLFGDTPDEVLFAREMEKRDRELEDFLNGLSGGASGTGAIVYQDVDSLGSTALAPDTQTQLAWTFDVSALGLDTGKVYRAVWDWVSTATVTGSTATDKPVAVDSYVEITAPAIGTLSPRWSWFDNVVRNESYLHPGASSACTASREIDTTIPYSGYLFIRNEGAVSGLPLGVSFWDLNIQLYLRITIYQLDT